LNNPDTLNIEKVDEMSEHHFLLKFFDRKYILKTFYLILFLSMLLIIDFYIALKLSAFINAYLLMFLLSISGFFGFVLGFFRVKSMLKSIMKNVDKGIFNKKSLYSYFGSIFGCIMLIVPGFVTDLLGIVLLVSLMKSMIGRIILNPHQDNLKTIYEYLRLN
jgi:UPF0716 protein FxsA